MGNITFAWEDVISVASQISGYLIFIGIIFIAMIAAMIVARKFEKPKKGFVRAQAGICFILILMIVVNLICFGPVRNQIEAAMAEKGFLSEETIAFSKNVIEEVASEGIVMTKNDDGALPIASDKINVFGWASTSPIYGGTGSGSTDVSTAVSILGGIENAGISVNQELIDMYTNYAEGRGGISINDGQDWTLPEPTMDYYTDSVMADAKAFSDTALIVIGRIGGEGADLPYDMGGVLDGSWNAPGTKYRNARYNNNSPDYPDFVEGQTYLELSKTEEYLVEKVCDNFDKVIVFYNGANVFEMGWTEQYDNIKSVLLCPGPGATGFNALGGILKGDVNPSGKTADTWVYDLTATPYYENVGNFVYTNVDDVVNAAKQNWERADGIASFVNYVEGIYTGYRYYETASDEGAINYDEVVQYPFGYGLSYSTFDQTMGELVENNGTISVDVTVTNTGDIAGKDVVQLYDNPPYTNGGLEKASANLIAFDKTDLLAPGESQTLTLSFTVEDLASYDNKNHRSYVLEAGDYLISLRTDSHNIVTEKTYTVGQEVVYGESNPRSTDQVAAVNHMGFAEGSVEYLSRADQFANYDKVTQAPNDFTLDPADGVLLANGTYDPTIYNDPTDVMPTTGANNGLEAYDLRGLPYNDPKWDELMDQVTIDEMINFIAFGGFGTPEIESIKLPSAVMADGPAGVNSFVTGSAGTGYGCELLLAQTFNTDLAQKMAEGMVNEMLDFKVYGWYAPSMNLHRTAFNGRNFEYYSEDPELSGEMAKAELRAAQERDIIPFLKHFALNEQETNRNAMLCTWASEQAIRELYLRPFEMSVKDNDGSPIAMMSVFNFIGTEWGGSSSGLLQDILRGEWGFEGFVLSDYFGNYGYMDADRAVRNGTDVMLGMAGNEAIMTDLSATSVLAMRQAVKNAVYTIANSAVYNSYDPNAIPGWIMTFYIVDALIIILLAVWEFLIFRKRQSNKA